MTKNLRRARKYLHKTFKRGSLTTGKKVWCGKNVLIDLTGDVDLGDYVILSDGVKLYTHYHDHAGHWIEYSDDTLHKINKVLCTGAFLYECIVTAKCSFIAKGVVIGAGAVVTKPIYDENTIWAGNPARKVKDR